MIRRIVVLGSPEGWVRQVAARIAALPRVECVYGAPIPEEGRGSPNGSGADMPYFTLPFDPDDARSVRELIGAAFAVVNLYRVYPGADRFIVPAACASLGVHYVDVCDAREYVSTFVRLDKEAAARGALLVTRANAVSALAAMLADMLALEFDRVTELHVAITPGLDVADGAAHEQESLERLFRLARARYGGRWRAQRWWHGAETVPFPARMGLHRGYGCDLPCLEELLKRYDARTATARLAFPPGLLSAFLASLAFPLRAGLLHRPSSVQRLLYLAAGFAPRSRLAAGIRVVLGGLRGRTRERYVASLVARNGSARAVGWSPVVALLRRWLARGVPEAGASSCVGLLELADLVPDLGGPDVVLVRE